MRVVNKFLAYRAEQEHKLIHGVDGKKLELGLDKDWVTICLIAKRLNVGWCAI
jgi:hypothetical protein